MTIVTTVPIHYEVPTGYVVLQTLHKTKQKIIARAEYLSLINSKDLIENAGS
jgi:hypothetical protein